jgi:hypothetical protein
MLIRAARLQRCASTSAAFIRIFYNSDDASERSTTFRCLIVRVVRGLMRSQVMKAPVLKASLSRRSLPAVACNRDHTAPEGLVICCDQPRRQQL